MREIERVLLKESGGLCWLVGGGVGYGGGDWNGVKEMEVRMRHRTGGSISQGDAFAARRLRHCAPFASLQLHRPPPLFFSSTRYGLLHVPSSLPLPLLLNPDAYRKPYCLPFVFRPPTPPDVHRRNQARPPPRLHNHDPPRPLPLPVPLPLPTDTTAPSNSRRGWHITPQPPVPVASSDDDGAAYEAPTVARGHLLAHRRGGRHPGI